MTAPWYEPEEDSPFQGMVGGALQRVTKKQQGIVLPYGPEWLKPTAPWDWNWEKNYLLMAYEYLNALIRGDIDKVMFFWPVRHGKTEAITVRFPVYWLEHFPNQKVIVGMHIQDKANEISRQARNIARTILRIDPEREAVQSWGTLEGGTYKAVGVGTALPGSGGNLFAIDDPIPSRKHAESPAYRDEVWNWWTNDLYSRREPKARLMFTMARWHEDDLAGRILNSRDGKNWTVLSIPALAEDNDPLGREIGEALDPSRFTKEELESARDDVFGSYAFAGLFQQRPAPAEGGIFKRIWWQFWQNQGQNLEPVRIRNEKGEYENRYPVILPEKMDETMQSWDMSFKDTATSDQVSGQVWSRKGSQAYLRDRDYGKKDFPKTVRAVKAMTLKWPQASRKLVEDAANGPAVIAQLRGRIGGMIAVSTGGENKVARAHAVTANIESGDVFLPHPHNEPWVMDFIEAFASFPAGKNDHDVDATTQLLRRMFPQGSVDNVEDYGIARIHA